MPSTADNFPESGYLQRLLQPWRSAKAKILWLTDHAGRPLGNHGDWVMNQVLLRILEENSIYQTLGNSDADLVIVPPNGALLDRYRYPTLLQEQLRGLEQKPLIIFPSSAHFTTADPARILRARTAPTEWVLREEASYDHLQEEWGSSLQDAGVQLHLDHDIVVTGRRYIPEIFGSTSEHLGWVVAARLGVEATDMRSSSNIRITEGRNGTGHAAKRLAASMPAGVIRPVRGITTLKRQRVAAESLLSALGASGHPLPSGHKIRRVRDLSDPTLCSRSRYLATVASASTIVTNRLHVALPAAVLAKNVYLVDSGYHKLSGVYDRSLEGVPNVKLIPR